MSAARTLRWPIFCAVVAVLVHWRAVDNGFVLDDVPLVANNPAIVTLAHLPRLFVEPYWNIAGESAGLYRPLTVASFAVNRAVLGAGPSGFHLVNIVLHGAVVLLVWWTLRRAGTHYGTALLGALLFAVLPIHTEAVANIAGRAELLAAFFVLAAWAAHRRASASRTHAGWWQLASTALYLAAILSKESAILAPALFLADDLLRGRDAAPRRGRLLLGYGAACAAMLALRGAALGAQQSAAATIPLDNPAAAAGSWPRLLTAIWVQLKYALLCVAPTQLVSDYSFDAIPVARSLADPRVVLGLAFVSGLIAAGVWGWRRSAPVTLAVVIWSVFFLPSANLLFSTGTIMAERLAYLPSLGVCLVLAHFGAGVAGRREPGKPARARATVVVAVAAIAICGLAARAWVRIPDWKSNLVLALADVATMPRSAKLQAGAGMFLAEAGQVTQAEDHLRRAVEIYPEYAQMHYNLAVLLARRGVRDEARAHLRRAVELAPGNPLPRKLLDQLDR